MPDQPIVLELFGGVELKNVDRAAADGVLTQPRLIALMAFLALSPADRPYQRRDRLVGVLWPELDQTHARTALRKAVHALRAALGADAIQSRGDEEIAFADGRLVCDVSLFLRQIDDGHLAAA